MMDESVSGFIKQLSELVPGLGAAHADLIEYWRPDLPPITTIFSELGRRLVDDVALLSPMQKEAVFDAIEKAMTSGNDILEMAVATGMIEAMIGRAKRARCWDEVRPMFGPVSGAHAAAWS